MVRPFKQTWGHFTVLFHTGFLAVCQTFDSCRPPTSLWWRFVLLLMMCRIGEASNPGPPQADSFVLGAFNPSGLVGKAPYFVSHLAHGDIWAVSETHLCSKSLQTFRASLRFADSAHSYCIGGHPVPAQHSRQFHAAWRGVATLSKHPTRELPTCWPHAITASSRALVTTTLVNDIWVSGGTVFGEPESGMYPQQKQNTEALLQAVIGHICHLTTGPRYVAGDWNVSHGSLPAFDTLAAAGFVDLQDLACQFWGQPVRPTCKRVTRRDFCFISRELQWILQSVHVQDDIFPDHSVLWGEFAPLSSIMPRQVWFQPQAFPWPQHWDVDPEFWESLQGDSDYRYHALWQHIEQTACRHVPFPVVHKCKGRAGTYTTRVVQTGRVPPPRKGRRKDVQPQYVAASFRHAQWLRQTRRLQAYIFHAKHSTHQTEHARAVWGSIVRARGFHPSFAGWWETCQTKVQGAPRSIPFAPPPWHVAEQLFDSVLLAFRHFERDLHKASRLYARQRRELNPNLIFQDIKPRSAKGVDILLQTHTAKIIDVRSDDFAVVLDSPHPFVPEQPIYCNGQQMPVIHVEADRIWVSDLTDLAVGNLVSQTLGRGTDDDLFHVFLTAWAAMWERHRHVPTDRWHTIVQFAKHALPRSTYTWPSLTSASLSQCIAEKKSTTTGGLDGVTLTDLKAMPEAALTNFVALVKHAEHTGEWPMQVVAGRVTCLPKTPAPETALDFRPITVLGLLYRCWGTYHAKRAIRSLDPVLQAGLFGSRPSCFAGQVWSHLLWSIELAYETCAPLSGLIVDLRKAFNFLPQLVVMEACAWVGIPFEVLRGWSGALATMPRHFQINGSLSPPAYSSCGLPEGCALSCVGMMVLDMVFHAWMLHFFPLCQPLSYVDDWQVLLLDPSTMDSVFSSLEGLTSAMDLQLDSRKTSTWCISPEGRSVVRAQGFGTVAYSRALGAHVQFSRQHTNKILMDRVNGLSELWTKLRLSACAYSQKVRALRCAAWPMGLHGVEATTLSTATFQTSRSGAMRGLRMEQSGANAYVQLGLIEQPLADPHCWAVYQTFRLARNCGSAARIEPLLVQLVAHNHNLPSNTITQTLLARIQGLGWHINDDGHLVDMLGPFSLFNISLAELTYRIGLHWPHVVAAATQHRPGFHGLQHTDAAKVRMTMQGLAAPDQGLFHKILNGTHITQDGKKYCQEVETDQCPFCLCSDSRYHRFWECERFEHRRASVPPQVRRMLVDMPESFTCYGWPVQPSTHWDWHQYFVDLLPAPIPQVEFIDTVHLFTDGSCHDQHDHSRRFASWAVGQAGLSVVDFAESRYLDSGVLPGLLQSAVRAEVYAVLRALLLTQTHAGPVQIWTDCQAVVRRFRKIQSGHGIQMSSTHADLWYEISSCLLARPSATTITRVAAHQCASAAKTVLEEWCFRHNNWVDRLAVDANFRRSPAFWELHSRHVQASDFATDVYQHVHRVQMMVSRAAVRPEEPPCLPPEPVERELPLPLVWKHLPSLQIPCAAVRWYGDAVVRLIISWFWQVVGSGEHPLRWMSHFQLYIDFMLSTGHPGPIRRKSWEDGSTIPNIGLIGYGFKQRARWWTKVWKECLRHLQVSPSYAYGRPSSQMLLLHTGVADLPWPPDRVSRIDQWMLKAAGSTFRRYSKLLDSLPYAALSHEFAPIYITTSGM